jgi:hypothetical protein
VGFNSVEADGSIDLQPRSEIAFLLLDGLKRQRPGGSGDVVLCALGLTRDGYPRPLMLRVVPAEDERAWRALLSDLRTEGIGPDLLLISADGHPALIKAIQATYPDIPLQICVAHRLLSLARKVDARWRGECLAGARKIFAAADRVTAVGLFREWHTQWLKHGEPAVRSLEADLASCLTFHRFPPQLWNRIRTVNLVERAFREARRSAVPASSAAPGGEEAPGPYEEMSGAEAVPDHDSGEDQEEKTVLIVPAATNGHVTPELIGDLTMLPEPEQAGPPEIEAPLPEEPEPAEPAADAAPSDEGEAPDEPVIAEEPALLEEATAVEPSTLSDLPEADPAIADVSVQIPPAPSPVSEVAPTLPEVGIAEIPAAAHVESAWIEPAPQEETAVWGPIDLSSDEEFDRRLAAHHRYAHQMRIAVTLTSAAGLMVGVVLAFIR